MVKNKGGREARKPKQDKKPKATAPTAVVELGVKRPKGPSAGR